MTTNTGSERFQSGGAASYAAYLETPEGRLRLDLAFANLLESLPQPTNALRVLDLGCGPGALGIRLARLGAQVTLLDSSQPMLNTATNAAEEAGVTEKVAVKQGDASQVAELFPAGFFDGILCHNVLEFVDDPVSVLRGATRALRDSSAILSVLVRNQAGEVLKAAVGAGDWAGAQQNLTTGWGIESLYGGRVRLFTPDLLKAMLKEASLEAIAERGVRVFADYLPGRISRDAEYEHIFQLERMLGERPDFAAIARYTQCLARRAGPLTKVSE